MAVRIPVRLMLFLGRNNTIGAGLVISKKHTASFAVKICDPTIFPTQYPTKVKDEVSVRLVRPAIFEGIKVQAKNSDTTYGTVMK